MGTDNKKLNYWKKILTHCQSSNFPTRVTKSNVSYNNYKTTQYCFSSHGFKKIRKSIIYNKYDSMVWLLTAMNVWFSKYTHQSDILVATTLQTTKPPISSINNETLLNQILPVKVKLNKNITISQALEIMNDVYSESRLNHIESFDSIVKMIKEKGLPDNQALFHSILMFDKKNRKTNIFSNLVSLNKNYNQINPIYSILWRFQENNEGELKLFLSYNNYLYDDEMIISFLDNLESTITNFMTSHLQTKLSNINILSNQQTKYILKSSTRNSKTLAEQSILDKIIESFDKYPAATALIDFDGVHSYEDLAQKASSIANYLKNKAVNKSSIGIYMDRSFNMVAAIIGILLSGNHYVPLDQSQPLDRLKYIINDANLTFTLVDSEEVAISKFVSLVNINNIGPCVNNKVIHNLYPDDLAYVVYTSGTTGQPKGVMVNHKNLLNLCDDFCNRLKLDTTSRFLSITSISFDIFALEIFCPLMCGSGIHMVPFDIANNSVSVVNFIQNNKFSHIQATPTMYRMIIDHIGVKGLKITALCGGETMDQNLFDKLQKIFSKAYNVYGPTETTIWSTCCDIKIADFISIGSPIQNTQCFILNKNCQICPPYVWGELFIAGDGLSLGYLGNDNLTAEVFKEINIGEKRISLYRTGDRARLVNKGLFACSGRLDTQIKLRGHRIEIQEIESVLNEIPFIITSAVILLEKQNESILIAYVTVLLEKPEIIIKENIREYLTQKLPTVMIPSSIEILEKLPLTTSGKIDRKKLLELNKSDDFRIKKITSENKIESQIREIWKKILMIENIESTDNFFIIGGNSVHIPQIVDRLNKTFNADITIRDFISCSTIENLSAYIEANLS